MKAVHRSTFKYEAAVVSMAIVSTLLLSFQQATADIYMHSPRGSNDRNCERNANRNNGNRLFDSQNNNAGGYGKLQKDYYSYPFYTIHLFDYLSICSMSPWYWWSRVPR